MNTKASMSIGIIAVILALLIFGIFIVNIASRDCNSNRDCPQESYCGSDFECHAFPEEIVVEKNNFTWAAIILSVGLITTAYIMKTGKIPFQKKKTNVE